MFGKNKVAKALKLADGVFNVHSIFHTIQGEGPHAGRPAIFVRFAGCNLRCFFCDTEFEKQTVLRAETLVAELTALQELVDCNFVVLTGGEPMLQPLKLLLDAPDMAQTEFQIETAGTVWPDGGLTKRFNPRRNLSIVCSPKTPTLVRELTEFHEFDVYWKYIVRDEPAPASDGLPTASTQIDGNEAILARPGPYPAALRTRPGPYPDALRNRIYVQPCDDQDPAKNARNIRFAAMLAMQHGYRLSLQTHKIAGLD